MPGVATGEEETGFAADVVDVEVRRIAHSSPRAVAVFRHGRPRSSYDMGDAPEVVPADVVRRP